MKKLVLIVLTLALAFSLCACEEMEALQKVELPSLPTVSIEPTAAPEITPIPGLDLPDETPVLWEEEPAQTAEPETRVIVNFKSTAYEEFDPAEGTQRILSFSYDTPIVLIDGRDAAAAAINEYIALLDETYYTGNDYGDGYSTGYNGMLEAAEDNFAYVMGNNVEGIPLEFSSTRTVRVSRGDDQVLSLVFTTYEYTGGAHGMYVEEAYCFDTVTGERISLDQLSTDFDAFAEELTRRMVEMATTDEYYADRIPDSFVSPEQYETAFAALLREGNWYLGSEGLTIFSDLEELGPYAAGIVEFTIPYDELRGMMDGRFFPAARDGEGAFSIAALADVPEGTIEILDRVSVEPASQELLLTVEGKVYDVRLATVYYSDQFYENSQVWYCGYMKDCAVQLAASIPEGLPNLMLSYQTADGERHNKLLSQNGMEGGFTLVNDSIQVLG